MLIHRQYLTPKLLHQLSSLPEYKVCMNSMRQIRVAVTFIAPLGA